jgi:MFS family permease
VTAHTIERVTPLTREQRTLAIGLVMGVTLVAFEMTAVITALPTISDELGGESLYGVALAAYTLADVVALVAAGELADRRGPTLPYTLSLCTFVVGLLVAASAPTMGVIVLGRALQGAGTGGLAPIAYILVKRAFPEDRQGSMFAFLSAGWVLPSLVAPAFGGLITDQASWRWVFLCIVPFAVVVALLATRPMRAYGPVTADHAPTRVPTAALAAIGIGAVTYGAQDDRLAVAVVLGVAGAVVALPALRRLLPAGTMTAAVGLSAVIACRTLATASFLGVDSFVPLAAHEIHGTTALLQGFLIVGGAISWTAGQLWRSRHPGRSTAAATRNGFLLLSLGALITWPIVFEGWPLWATFLTWCVGGLGMGLLFNPTSLAAMSYARTGQEGIVSSQTHLADSLGFSVMGGYGGALVAAADRGSWSMTSALSVCMLSAAALAALGAVVAGRTRRAQSAQQADEIAVR